MKIECPNCKLTGQVSDANIPPEGRGMECPRCKASFFVQKQAAANWADTVTDCPECGFSTFTDERFDICPKCGLVVKDFKAKGEKEPAPAESAARPGAGERPDPEFLRQELERVELEDRRKRQQRLESVGTPLPPAGRKEPEPEETPAQIKYLGWLFVLLALVILAYGGKGFHDYLKITPAEAVTSSFDEPPTPLRLYLTHGLSPVVLLFLGIFFLVGGIQFAVMRPWARKALEAASWVGVIFVVCRELTTLVMTVRRATSGATADYYAMEFAGFLLMAVFWSSPLLVAIWCLRRDFVRDSFDG